MELLLVGTIIKRKRKFLKASSIMIGERRGLKKGGVFTILGP
jgi:hypothetical protein